MLSTLIVPYLVLQAQAKPAPAVKAKPADVSVPATIKTPTASKVIVMVNGESITAGAVEPYLWDWKSDEVIDNLVSFKLVEMEAKRLHIKVTPEEVKKTVNDELAQFKASLPPGTDAMASLRQKGYPFTRIELTVKSSILLEKIAALDFKPADFVKISAITVQTTKTSTPAEVDAAKKTSQDYYDRLAKNEPWATVLASSTKVDSVIKSDGQIGWRSLKLSSFPAGAVTELTAMKIGQYTHPLVTDFGVQIFRLDATGATAKPAELKSLRDAFVQTKRNDVMQSLRNKAKIVKIN